MKNINTAGAKTTLTRKCRQTFHIAHLLACGCRKRMFVDSMAVYAQVVGRRKRRQEKNNREGQDPKTSETVREKNQELVREEERPGNKQLGLQPRTKTGNKQCGLQLRATTGNKQMGLQQRDEFGNEQVGLQPRAITGDSQLACSQEQTLASNWASSHVKTGNGEWVFSQDQ